MFKLTGRGQWLQPVVWCTRLQLRLIVFSLVPFITLRFLRHTWHVSLHEKTEEDWRGRLTWLVAENLSTWDSSSFSCVIQHETNVNVLSPFQWLIWFKFLDWRFHWSYAGKKSRQHFRDQYANVTSTKNKMPLSCQILFGIWPCVYW